MLAVLEGHISGMQEIYRVLVQGLRKHLRQAFLAFVHGSARVEVMFEVQFYP